MFFSYQKGNGVHQIEEEVPHHQPLEVPTKPCLRYLPNVPNVPYLRYSKALNWFTFVLILLVG